MHPLKPLARTLLSSTCLNLTFEQTSERLCVAHELIRLPSDSVGLCRVRVCVCELDKKAAQQWPRLNGINTSQSGVVFGFKFVRS